MVQVYCLLVYDVVVFLAIVQIEAFEGRRNTALALMLGFSRIFTTGLSVAFLPIMNMDRIVASTLGIIIIIIIIRGLLTIGLMILVVLSAVSTYLSLTRNRESIKPGRLTGARARYLAHLYKQALDIYVSKAERQKSGKDAKMHDAPPELSCRWFQSGGSSQSTTRKTKTYLRT